MSTPPRTEGTHGAGPAAGAWARPGPDRGRWNRARLSAGEVASAAVALGLVVVAAVVGARLNDRGEPLYAGAAPLFGWWMPHVGPGTPAAVLVAIAVIAFGPGLAARLAWPRLLALGYAAALAWTASLAMVDGWPRGWADRLTGGDEYLHEVPGIAGIGSMLRGFEGRILDFQPDSWTTHVAGHPPGALLVFVGLDRIGLGGGAAAATVCVLVGASVAVSVPIALRALGDEDMGRASVGYLALFPGAVWVGVSADGLFAGVVAWGIALLAVGLRSWPAALTGGAVLGFGLFLSYGLALAALPALAVLVVRVAGRSWSPRPALLGAAGAGLVVAGFAVAGFWWFDGYHLVVQRYHQGIATERPYGYWVWANLAALVLAAGPAAAAAAAGVFRQVRTPIAVLALAAGIAVLVADVSGLSKAETERIWLPFGVWLAAAAAVLPRARCWLAVNAAVALAVNHLVLTGW